MSIFQKSNFRTSSFRRSTIFAITFLIMLGASPAVAQKYFPDKTLDDSATSSKFLAEWCSRELRSMKEPSLFESASNSSIESYRFLWLRAFGHPVAIRIELKPGKTGRVTTKVLSGAGGLQPGHLSEVSSRELTSKEMETFLKEVAKDDFWYLPSYSHDRAGMDGSEWIIEGVKAGKYHVITRWTPNSGAVHDLGLNFIFCVAHMNIPKNELY